MQSGREASSSQLHEEAPPSVSWRKAFMYTAVATAATAATCSARRMQLGDSGPPDAEDHRRRVFSDADLAR